MPDPERVPIVDLAEVFDRASRELVAAGYEDEDEPLQPGEIRVHQGDGRLR
jgi:hypothetical protein